MKILIPTAIWLVLLIATLLWSNAEERHGSSRIVSPTLPGLVTAVYFVIINSVNWGSAGWYETYGFPLTYFHWSHASSEMNGRPSGTGLSLLGATVDTLVAVSSYAAVQLFATRPSRTSR